MAGPCRHSKWSDDEHRTARGTGGSVSADAGAGSRLPLHSPSRRLAVSPGGRAAAVKVLTPQAATDPVQVARLRAATDVARQVSGAYTASFLDAQFDAAPAWLALAYIPSVSLASAVADQGAFSGENLRWLAGVSSARLMVSSWTRKTSRCRYRDRHRRTSLVAPTA